MSLHVLSRGRARPAPCDSRSIVPVLKYTIFMLLVCCGVSACSVLPSSDDPAGCTLPIVRVTGVEVTPLDREVRDGGQVHYVHSHALRGQIVFEVRVEHEAVGEAAVACPDDPLVDLIPGRVVNPIEPFGHVVRFNRPIRAHGTIMPADTNLLAVPALEEDYGLRTSPSPFAIAQVRFEPATYTFPAGTYRGTFAWVTGDGAVLQDQVEVHIDVE